MRLESIRTEKKTITARLAVHKLMRSDTVKETLVTVKPGDSLEAKTGRKDYAGFDIDEINPGGGFVRFANNVELKKRQEIGRGVRLSVDQSGDRVKDEKVNVLTVVANESYERYVERLQSEIEEEYGAEGLPPKPADARKRVTVRLRKECTLRPEFKELWERIKHKTRYAVQIDTQALLKDVAADIDKLDIRPPRITVAKARVDVVAEGPGAFTAAPMTASKTALYLDGRHPLPNGEYYQVVRAKAGSAASSPSPGPCSPTRSSSSSPSSAWSSAPRSCSSSTPSTWTRAWASASRPC